MDTLTKIQERFNQLSQQANSIRIKRSSEWIDSIDNTDWQKWSTSVMNLLVTAFGEKSVHYQNFKEIYDTFQHYESNLESAKGVFLSAKEDFEGGYIYSLETAISGELFGDFVSLAKQSLSEGYKDVAAVLSCAALEDALKRYAKREGIDVQDEVMQQVVNALKAKGLVTGAQKTLLDTMPKIRDYAMHANWEKIKSEDVSSVIGFVEQFIINKF